MKHPIKSQNRCPHCGSKAKKIIHNAYSAATAYLECRQCDQFYNPPPTK